MSFFSIFLQVSNSTSGRTQSKPPCNRTSSKDHTNDQFENRVIIQKEPVDVPRPGQTNPHQAENSISNLHSELQSNLPFRQDESFFNNPPANQKSTLKQSGGTDPAPREEPPAPTRSKGGDADILSEELARARQVSAQFDYSKPEGTSSHQERNSPSDGVSANGPPHSTSNSTGNTDCKKKKKDKAVSGVRAAAPAAAQAVQPVQNQTLSATTPTTHQPTNIASVPNLSQSIHHHGLNPGALAGISLAMIILASIPITIAIIRRRRRRKQIRVMFEQGPHPTQIRYAHAAPDFESGNISPGDIDELMNRVASVQAPKRKETHAVKNFS